MLHPDLEYLLDPEKRTRTFSKIRRQLQRLHLQIPDGREELEHLVNSHIRGEVGTGFVVVHAVSKQLIELRKHPLRSPNPLRFSVQKCIVGHNKFNASATDSHMPYDRRKVHATIVSGNEIVFSCSGPHTYYQWKASLPSGEWFTTRLLDTSQFSRYSGLGLQKTSESGAFKSLRKRHPFGKGFRDRYVIYYFTNKDFHYFTTRGEGLLSALPSTEAIKTKVLVKSYEIQELQDSLDQEKNKAYALEFMRDDWIRHTAEYYGFGKSLILRSTRKGNISRQGYFDVNHLRLSEEGWYIFRGFYTEVNGIRKGTLKSAGPYVTIMDIEGNVKNAHILPGHGIFCIEPNVCELFEGISIRNIDLGVRPTLTMNGTEYVFSKKELERKAGVLSDYDVCALHGLVIDERPQFQLFLKKGNVFSSMGISHSRISHDTR